MMDRQAVIHLAMEAATHYEDGYDPQLARESLEGIEPDYDWEPELFQLELETTRRRMGPEPYREPTEFEKTLLRLYEPTIKEMLKPSPFIQLFDKEDKGEVAWGGYPLTWGDEG